MIRVIIIVCLRENENLKSSFSFVKVEFEKIKVLFKLSFEEWVGVF